MIDDENFLNFANLYVKDKRIDNSNEYKLMGLFLNLLAMGEIHDPIHMQNICNHQQQDAELQQQH